MHLFFVAFCHKLFHAFKYNMADYIYLHVSLSYMCNVLFMYPYLLITIVNE